MTKPRSDETTDGEWERVAQDNPYWGVLSHDEFDRARSDDERMAEFWSSGQSHIRHVAHYLRTHVAPDFAPATAVDFGCGVGRLLIPLAHQCRHVYGVDVSDTMRKLATDHLAEQHVDNATLAATLDELDHLRDSVDLVHSVLVFQHIRTGRGLELFDQLVALLAPGGCGAVQFFLGRLAPWWRQTAGIARQRYRPVNIAVNLARGRFTTEALPYEMNPYDMKDVYAILGRVGITEMWVENYVQPDGVYSTLYFARPT